MLLQLQIVFEKNTNEIPTDELRMPKDDVFLLVRLTSTVNIGFNNKMKQSLNNIYIYISF